VQSAEIDLKVTRLRPAKNIRKTTIPQNFLSGLGVLTADRHCQCFVDTRERNTYFHILRDEVLVIQPP
jgi:hypothetical protein